MKTCKSLLPAVLTLAFMITTTAAAAPTLTFKFTKVNVPGALATGLGGINNSGVIVGEYEDTKSVEHCFMLSKTINVPGAANSFAFDTNTAGDMVYETLNSSAT